MSVRRIMLPMLVALVGMGLGVWAMATPAHGTVIALDPLQITKITTNSDHIGPADNHVLPGNTVYYQIAIHNPNDVTVDLNTLSDTLPSGFSYNSGSSGDLATFDPQDIIGQTLTWTFDGETVGGGATAHLNFSADVSAEEPLGMYCNQATVDWFDGSATTGLTAPVQVLTEGGNEITLTCAQPTVVRLRTHTPTVTATAPATETPLPSTATATPAPPTATQPSGGSAGIISAPNTGAGPAAGGPNTMILVVAALMVIGGLGAAAAGVIRR